MPTGPDEFPRGRGIPAQTPQYWVGQKDRYIRQLLISDIEEQTGRDLVVYFGSFEAESGQIHPQDVRHLHDVLQSGKRDAFDLFLQTSGGFTDATEQLVSLLRGCGRSYRAIVPTAAKSNGTVLALSADKILIGPASELGPIDPSFGPSPATFILKILEQESDRPPSERTVNPMFGLQAEYAIKQTQKMAKDVLGTGMMKGSQEAIDAVVQALSTRERFHSHRSVVNRSEAKALGLNVLELDHNSDLYRRLWLLSCLLESDARNRGLAKIYEGSWASFELYAPLPA